MASAVILLSEQNLFAEPGGVVSCQVQVHNVSSIVEQFHVEVVGETAQWATVESEVISLFPNTSRETVVTWNPPKVWYVHPGKIPFGIRVVAVNNPNGSVTEEGLLEIGEFRDLKAELIPEVTIGRRRGKLGLAIDSFSNVAVTATVSGRDQSDTLQIVPKPKQLELLPGTTSFTHLRILPRRRYLRGPQRNSRFKVTVAADNVDPIVLDATMLQKPVLPKGSLLILAALIMLGVWLLVRNEIKNAAVAAIQPQLANQQHQNISNQMKLNQLSKTATKASKQASEATKKASIAASIAVRKSKSSATSTTTTAAPTTTTSTTTTTAAPTTTAASATTAAPTTTTPTTTTTAAPTTTTTAVSSTTSTSTTTTAPPTAAGNQLTPGPYSNAISVAAAPGQVSQGLFVVPTGNELDLTDIIIENLTQVTGSTVQVGIQPPGAPSPKYFFEMSLSQLTSQDFPLSTPLVLPQGATFVITVSCSGGGSSACGTNVYFGGTAQLLSGG